MEGSQPEKDTTEEQYIMSGMTSVVDSDGRARVFYMGSDLGFRHVGPPGVSQCYISLRSNSSQPKKDINDEQYMLGGVASVADSYGIRLTCGSGL
uniref:DOMON domain-containing protein n=1 Tax=Mesocestoides corti TaxID=53468 RepID=A0A5K3G5E2_MESCO